MTDKRSKLISRIAIGSGILLAASSAFSASIWLPKKERPKGSGPRIVCIGDSITFGAGVAMTRNRDAWTRILARKLKGRYEVLNYGIIGATLLREGKKPYSHSFWKAAKALRAQIYILMLGTNDAGQQIWNAIKYAQQLRERVLELKNEASPEHIYLMAPPPTFKKKEMGRHPIQNTDEKAILSEIRDIVRLCAEENGADFIDLYGLLDGHPEYMTDGVHPNKLGNEVISEIIMAALKV